jgi:hypothetical protein
MQHALQNPPLEAHVWVAWQTQLAATVHMPGLLSELVHHRHELFPSSTEKEKDMKSRSYSRRNVPRLFGMALVAVVFVASVSFHLLYSTAFAQEPTLEDILDQLYGLENLSRINDEDDQWWINRDGNATARAKFAALFQTLGVIDASQGFLELFTETGEGFDVSGFGTLPAQDALPHFRWRLNEWSSRPGDNTDQVDHMFTWLITDGPSAGNLVIAWEDLFGGGDGDYQDMVVEVSQVPLHSG